MNLSPLGRNLSIKKFIFTWAFVIIFIGRSDIIHKQKEYTLVGTEDRKLWTFLIVL